MFFLSQLSWAWFEVRYEKAGAEQNMPFISDMLIEFWLAPIVMQTASLTKRAARASKVFLAPPLWSLSFLHRVAFGLRAEV